MNSKVQTLKCSQVGHFAIASLGSMHRTHKGFMLSYHMTDVYTSVAKPGPQQEHVHCIDCKCTA